VKAKGSDTYVFGHGSGRDVINNFGTASSGSEDLIQDCLDISPVDIPKLRREGNHMAAYEFNGSEGRADCAALF